MHILFVGEADDGISVSSHHARALATTGIQTTFDVTVEASPEKTSSGSRPEIIHLVTFEQRSNSLLRRLVAARVAGVQIVRYWSGRDLLWAKYHKHSLEFARALLKLGSIQLCRSLEISRELESLGINATPIPVISANISSAAPPQAMPSIFTVLCYLPPERRTFHGGPIVDALVEKLPSVRFLVLGSSSDRLACFPNVEILSDYCDCMRAIHRSSVIIDPRADHGFSRLQLEALSHGRHVISSCEIAHGSRAATVTEYADAIRSIRQKPSYNLDGRSHVARDHERHTALRTLRKALEDALEPGRLNLVLEGGVRGAAAAFQNLHILSQRDFPLPEEDRLPPQAYPLRCLLQDMQFTPQPARS